MKYGKTRMVSIVKAFWRYDIRFGRIHERDRQCRQTDKRTLHDRVGRAYAYRYRWAKITFNERTLPYRNLKIVPKTELTNRRLIPHCAWFAGLPQFVHNGTSVYETRRSSKLKLHLKNKKNQILRNTILSMADAMSHDHDIDFAR